MDNFKGKVLYEFCLFLQVPGEIKKVDTHETVLVTNVVRQLQFVEGDNLLHPLFTRRR